MMILFTFATLDTDRYYTNTVSSFKGHIVVFEFRRSVETRSHEVSRLEIEIFRRKNCVSYCDINPRHCRCKTMVISAIVEWSSVWREESLTSSGPVSHQISYKTTWRWWPRKWRQRVIALRMNNICISGLEHKLWWIFQHFIWIRTRMSQGIVRSEVQGS